ncbi:hypothetical protein T484DRAFT_3628078, partial [Baffinella frigidus]
GGEEEAEGGGSRAGEGAKARALLRGKIRRRRDSAGAAQLGQGSSWDQRRFRGPQGGPANDVSHDSLAAGARQGCQGAAGGGGGRDSEGGRRNSAQHDQFCAPAHQGGGGAEGGVGERVDRGGCSGGGHRGDSSRLCQGGAREDERDGGACPPRSPPGRDRPRVEGTGRNGDPARQQVHPKPETRNPKPETINPEPGTRNCKPGTRNPKPETRNPKPGTRNPKPGTRNPEPETRNPKPGTRNPKPETRNP